MANATIAASMPRMAEVFSDTPDSEFLAKLILTTPALFIVIFAPLAGYCIDRWGRLKFLYGSLLLYGAAGSSGFYLDSLPEILGGRACLGVAVAGIMTTTTTLLGDYFSGHERLRFAGLQGMFFSMAGMVFVGAGGVLAEFGWRLPFLVYLSSWVALIPAVMFLREPTRHARENRGAERARAPVAALALAYGLTFFLLVVFYMTPVQLPFLLKSIGVESAGLAALAIGLGSLASGGGSFLQHRIHYRLGFVSIYSAAMLFLVAGYALIAYADHYATAMLGTLVSGFGAGVLFPNAAMWVTTLAPAHLRGRLLGGMTASMYLGQFFSPIVVQPVVSVSGLSWAFGIFAMLALVLSGVLWLTARGFDRHAVEESAPDTMRP